MTTSRVNHVTAARSPGGACSVALITSALLLLLPQQLVLMTAVGAGSTAASGVSASVASNSQEPEQPAESKALDVNQWTADDFADDLAALKASRHRLTAAEILRQHPYLGGGKRRAHIFVGKRGKLAELAAADDAEDDYDDGVFSDLVVKRPRMFVGKRPAVNDEDIVDGELYADDWQRQQDVEKRPRMFVGKRKAPVFVGKRSVDAVLHRRVAP